MRPGGVRASDAEREQVALALRDHCAEGRLTLEELDSRLERVYASSTRDELAALVSDLPETVDRRPPAPSGRRIFWPGITAFHERRHLRTPCSAAYQQALGEMVPRMGMHGFHLVADVAPRRLVFAGDTGLHVTVMFQTAADGGTDVSAFGTAQRAVRKAFATLSD